MFKNIVFSLLLICFIKETSFAQSQESDRIFYPSPTAASLGKYGDYPVSLYTGQVNIGIPIYSISSGKLTLPISLSYSGTGNKPSDIPGWVGLGWSLGAGGVITRIVQDIPDDCNSGYYYTYNEIRTQLQQQEAGTPNEYFYKEYISKSRDIKPDIFQFNFDGHTGKFFFDLYGNIRFSADERYKITFTTAMGNGQAGFFDTFVITTDNGTKYTFSAKEWSIGEISQITGLNKYVSSWYLSKIESPYGDEITLTYTTANQKYRFKEYAFQKELHGVSGGIPINDSYISQSRAYDEVIYLKEIVWPNGKIKFNTSLRNDILFRPVYLTHLAAEERKLDEIVLMDEAEVVKKKWQLSYFETDTRLKPQYLKEVSAAGPEHPPYEFVYYPISLPGASGSINPYYSNRVDYWGYFNGAANGAGLIPFMDIPGYGSMGNANRNTNANFVKAEMLSKIIYPTGGFTEFEFEAHDYSNEGFLDGTRPISDDYVWDAALSFFYESGQFEVDPYTISFTLTEPSLVKIIKSSVNVGPNKAWNPTGYFEQINTMQPGTYTLAQALGAADLTNGGSSDIQTAEASISIRRRISVVNKLAGGVRIKSIKKQEGSNITTRSFAYTLETNPSKSSGVLAAAPVNYIYLQSVWVGITGLWLSSGPLHWTPEGPVIGYSNVVETLENGSKIKHAFNNYNDYPDELGTVFHFVEHELVPLTSRNYWRGLENNTKFLNSAGEIVKEVINEYDVNETPAYAVDVPVLDFRLVYRHAASGEGSVFNRDGYATLASKYFLPCRFAYRKRSKEIIHSTGNNLNVLANENFYFYENPLHLQLTRLTTVGSDNKTVEKKFNYPTDMISLGKDPNGIYQGMIDKNMINPVIEELHKKNNDQVSFSRTNYFQPFTGLFVPKTTDLQKRSTDLYQTVFMYRSYDNKGNLLSKSSGVGARNAFLWDYKQSQPIAEAINADISKIAYTSFEADGTGNWNIGSTTRITTDGITGKNCYQLANGNISKAGLNVASKYSITYWSKNGSYSVNGGNGVLQTGPTVNSWTFYKHIVTTTSSTVTISGSGLIDELRLYPYEAQMSTYTYDPLLGMTSQCDVNNRISYYEYDGFGRLVLVRDQDRNVIRKMEYKYRLQ